MDTRDRRIPQTKKEILPLQAASTPGFSIYNSRKRSQLNVSEGVCFTSTQSAEPWDAELSK